MKLITSDEKMVSKLGSNDYLFCFYSTIFVNLSRIKQKISLALDFLRTGECKGADGYEIARQFNIIRDELSQLSTDKIVYNMSDPNIKAPWSDKISPVVTSCGNFFTTSEGKDLIYEINTILCYAKVKNVDVSIRD